MDIAGKNIEENYKEEKVVIIFQKNSATQMYRMEAFNPNWP